jgi:hypothetical protein
MNKLRLLKSAGVWVSVIFLVCGPRAFAGETPTKGKEKICSGTITSVNAKEKVLKVQSFLFSKTFVVGDNCVLSVADRRQATLGDFRAGQKVEVQYKDAGVLIANRIVQEKLAVSGEVQMIDRGSHVLKVRNGGGSKTFKLEDNCAVLLIADNRGTLEDVKLGNRVTVVYEAPGDLLVAREIEQKSVLFIGILDGVNAEERTLSVGKRFLGDKKFHLADRCAIIVDGRQDAKLNELRLGRKYELNYDNVDGVNVVNRIAQVEELENASVPRQTVRSTVPTR